MKQKTVWAIVTEWYDAKTGEHEHNVSVYSTESAARVEFQKLVARDKDIESSHGHYNPDNPDECCYEWEDNDNYWAIWESGYYNEQHSEIKLCELPLE